jgi:hypothetical protein
MLATSPVNLFKKGRTVANSLTNRSHSILLICALMAVLATCAIGVTRVSLAGVSPVCHGPSPGDSAPVGYRLP